MALLPDNFDLQQLAGSLTSRLIPTEGSTDIPSFRVFSENTELPDMVSVISVSVSRSVNKISSARIILSDGDRSKEDFELSSTDMFIPGKKIRVEMGYQQKNRTVFEGVIVKHALKARMNQPSLLIIDIKHEAIKMTSIRKSVFHNGTSDDDIISKIIESNGFTVDSGKSLASVPSGVPGGKKEVVQFNATDWDFVLSRVDAIGKYVFTPDGKAIGISKPNLTQTPIVMANFGSSIIEVEAEMDATHQYEAVKANSWDPGDLKMENGDANYNMLTKQGNIDANQLADVLGNKEFQLFHSGSIEKKELIDWATAKLQRSRLSKIRGRVKITGFGSAMPGDMILLNGLGDRFNGSAFVSGIRHEMNDGGWTTDIQFGLPHEGFTHADEDVSAKPTSGLLPAISGLVTGIVTQLEKDPDGQSRVRVRIPVINDKDEGIWARITGLDFGNNKGTFFMPDKGDEVVLGFLNDDPRYPIILGALYSSKNAPPFPLSDTNFEKGIVTKAGVKISINDEKKIVIIETPNKNMVTISDEDKKISILDQNKNKLEMSTDGIIIESGKDFSIKATGDIKIEGVNVSVKASGEFKAEGSGGIEVSSTATAILKGAIVQIN